MRRVPYAAAGAGARIAAADARDAGRRRTTAFAAGAISGTGSEVHAMDLGTGVWTGGNGSLCALYGVYPALANGTRKSRIRRVEPAGAADFSGRNVERMAVHDYIPRGTGDGDAGGASSHVLSSAGTARVGAGRGLSGSLRLAGGAAGGVVDV